MVGFVKDRKITNEAKELLEKVNPEEAKILFDLYVKQVKKADEHEWRIGGLINANDVLEDSEDDVIAVPLTSVYGGEKVFNIGDQFVNVIGSNYDYNTDGNGDSWMSLMRIVYRTKNFNLANLNTCCAQLGVTRVNPTNGVHELINHNCTNNIVGAHVTDQVEGLIDELPAGYQFIYLLPLCRSLNASRNIIMAANRQIIAIKLMNYRQ